MENIVAIIENNIVINMIVADDVEIAEALYPNAVCVNAADYDPRPSIGMIFTDGVFASQEIPTEGV
jgi:hypothetical protein